jgi:hypothetical protein
MSRKLLGYEDAVKLLGGESRLVAALGKLAGAGLAGVSLAGLAHGNVPAAIGMFELKDEIVSQGQEAVTTLRQRFTGLNRFERSELLEAAHAVLVVSAFFAALDDLDAELRTAINSASLELTKPEQVALATVPSRPASAGLPELAHQLITPGRIPGLDGGLVSRGRGLADYYTRLARIIRNFAAGTAAWDQRDETTRDRWSLAVSEHLPRRALARYEEQLTRLAGEFPEFAFWAHRVGVQAILAELRAARSTSAQLETTLQTVTALLASVARGPGPAKVRSDLVARYRDQVARPIAGATAGNIPEGVGLPALRDLYINPSYKTLRLSRAEGIGQISEPGWRDTAAQRDLSAMVLEFLISTEATRVPLVLLGQPGAGKSVFTQMLAAELDPRDYLVVRVELRAVPSDTGIQEQIEAALESLTGRAVRWPDLAESAEDAQPVILLDGFDELLQASGVSHADFLERIQAFQEREAGLGRPAAVLLTSRTAVANQVRYPDGTLVARLEEFDPGQVGSWLDTWNRVNSARPLAAETALAQGELGHQPLLLFLLAFFHSGGGDLAPGISQAHLYQRLFTSFVERDVRKLDAGLGESQQQLAVQRDLDLLSMVAFAMFNRGRQSVTETDLIADLTAMQYEQPGATGAAARAAALSTAERIAGRFFFRLLVHRDQAMSGQQAVRSTYEFLHASFGEFLVARWVVGELGRLGEQARRAADDLDPPPLDDSKLYALLSVTVLSMREQRVLDFIADLLAEKEPGELAALRALTGKLFRACLQPRSHDRYPQYQPAVRTAPAFYAAHSANLVLLLLLIGEAQARATGDDGLAGLSASEVAVSARHVTPEPGFGTFHAAARLWHSQLTGSEWESLLGVVRVHHPQTGEQGRDAEVAVSRWTEGDHQIPMSGHEILYGFPSYLRDDALVRLDSPAGAQFREAALLGAGGYQDACDTLMPYINALGRSGNTAQFQTGEYGGGFASYMLGLLIPAPGLDAPDRARLYKKVFTALPGIRAARLLLERLRHDIRHLPHEILEGPVLAARPYAWAHINAYLDVLSEIRKVASSLGIDVPVSASEMTSAFEKLDVKFDSGGDIIIERAHDPGTTLMRLLNLASPAQLLRLLYSDELVSTRPRDLNGLLRLAQSHMDDDPSVLLGIYEIPELVRLIGLLDILNIGDPLDPLELRDLNDLNDPIDPSGREYPRTDISREYSSAVATSLVHIALWAELTRRELTWEPPPPALRASDVARLAPVAPDFVRQTRRLASERGFLDPLPAASPE